MLPKRIFKKINFVPITAPKGNYYFYFGDHPFRLLSGYGYTLYKWSYVVFSIL